MCDVSQLLHSLSLREDIEQAKCHNRTVRYLVTARVKAERLDRLKDAIERRTLGRGSVAGSEYLHDMRAAREDADGRVKWVETCFCPTPLQEERPYWEEYFVLEKVQDAHARSRCRQHAGQKGTRSEERLEIPPAAKAEADRYESA